MISYEDMPEDNQDLAKIEISFPSLSLNTAQSSPVQIKEILEYLEREAPSDELIKSTDLKFIQTAQVAEMQYWIWEFFDNENTKYYVTVSKSPQGDTCIVYDEDYYNLTPEQFMLGTYHNVF